MSKKKRLEKKEKKNVKGPAEANAANATNSQSASKDTSPKVYQREKIAWELQIRERFELTEKQKVIMETILHKDTRCVFIDGTWGTSKTYVSVLGALKLLNLGKCKEIKYLRNPIEASKSAKIGLLPGGLDEKMTYYTAPFYDKLKELLPKGDIDKLTEDERLECNAIGFIRGASWNATVVIVDECAGLDRDDFLLTLSRCGPYTRIIFAGDSAMQNDLGTKSGFKDMFDLFNDDDSRANGIHTFELRDEEDIVRSDFIKYVMKKAGIIRPLGQFHPENLIEIERNRSTNIEENANSNDIFIPSSAMSKYSKT